MPQNQPPQNQETGSNHCISNPERQPECFPLLLASLQQRNNSSVRQQGVSAVGADAALAGAREEGSLPAQSLAGQGWGSSHRSRLRFWAASEHTFLSRLMTDRGSALFMMALPDTIMLAPAWETPHAASHSSSPCPQLPVKHLLPGCKQVGHA